MADRQDSERRSSARSPLWKVPVEREVADEVDFHLEMRTREYVAEGMSEDEARRKALERFGEPERHLDECRRLAHDRDRRFRIRNVIGEARQDGMFALRQLFGRPAFAITLLGILALGIGANVAGFSLINGLLLQPLPFDQPDRLVTLWEAHVPRGGEQNVVGPANFMEWRDQNESFEDLAGFITVPANLTGDGPARRIKNRLVTDRYFELLGREAFLGRTLEPSDYAEGARPLAVLSHGLWSERYGADQSILGSTIQLGGRAFEVIGVMPSGIELDMGPGVQPYGDAPDLFTQLPIVEQWRQPRGRWLMVLARLKDGVTLDQARLEMTTIAARLRDKFPDFDDGWDALVIPLREQLQSAARGPALALYAAVALMLLIVAVNVASLLVARAATRAHEIAVRQALGAGRRRLIRQALTEGTLVAVLGAAGGMVVAWVLLRTAVPMLPAEMSSDALRLDGGVLVYAVGLLTGCALLFGLVPALQGWRSASVLLRSRGGSGGRSRQRLRQGLVFVEVALSVVLLVGAGLMLRSIRSLLAVESGFDRDRVLTASLSVPADDPVAVRGFYDDLLVRLDALPGVRRAAAISHVPMASVGAATGYWPTALPEVQSADRPTADIRIVRGEYFAAMGIPLLDGRLFDRRDQADRPAVALVSASLAGRFWPDESALGKMLRISWGDDGDREIVGVVADVHHADLATEARDAIYFPHDQEMSSSMSVVVATRTDPNALIPELRSAVASLDPELPIADLTTLDTIVSGTVAERRFILRALTAFALMSLLLAAIAIYGTASYSVVQRQREIGLRMALGARPGDVGRMVMRQVGLLVALALGAGLVIALGGMRVLDSLLYQVEASDPATLVGVTLVLAAAALMALALPALRAARVAPVDALRLE